MRSPNSRMDILSANEITALVNTSTLVDKYLVDRKADSADELLKRKIELENNQPNNAPSTPKSSRKVREKDWTDNPMVRDVSRTATRKIIDWIMKLLTAALKGKK